MDVLHARDDEIAHYKAEISRLGHEVEDRVANLRHFVDVERQLEERLNTVSAELLSVTEK